MQNYRAGPVGPVVGVRGVGARGAGGKISEERDDEGGGATRGPGSTSTHLNFGPSQGQCGRTTRSPFSPLRHLLRFLFFLFARPILSFCPFLTRSAPLPLSSSPSTGPVPHYRVIPCWDPRPLPCRRMFLFFWHRPTYDPAKSQLVEISA